MNNVINCNLTGSFSKHLYHNNINTKELIWRRWQKPLLMEDRRTFIIHCQYHVMLMSWRRVESWHQQAWHWPIFFTQYSSLRTDSYILWQEIDLKVDCILPMNHFNVFCLTCHNCFYHCIAFFDKIITYSCRNPTTGCRCSTYIRYVVVTEAVQSCCNCHCFPADPLCIY